MKIRSFLPISIAFLGIAFTIFLLIQIPEGTYFSGDAGLKALLARQLARGIGQFDLLHPSQTWVLDLWRKGLYPYSPPYVYDFEGRYFITFPYTFPLVTAIFYRQFGYWGLYAIPLLGTWIVWVLFYAACRAVKYSDELICLGLGILIFASPFTLYSAMYWEHSLAVALGFGSIVMLLWNKKIQINSLLSRSISILSGILLGLSVWFRPELLCLMGLMVAGGFVQKVVCNKSLPPIFRRINPDSDFRIISHPLCFNFSAITTSSLFFLSNQFIYGQYLGIHGIQVAERASLSEKIQNAIANFEGMGITFVIFMPTVAFILYYFSTLLVHRPRVFISFPIVWTSSFSFFFLIGVSILVPPGTAGLIAGGVQWGTRFLLLLVPVLILTTIEALRLVLKYCKPLFKFIGIAIFSGLLLLGIYKNSVEGSSYLFQTYRDSSPIVNFLVQSPERIVAISHQFVAQKLEAATNKENFWFLVETPEQLVTFSQVLLREKVTDFTYICYPYRPCPLPKKSYSQVVSLTQNQLYFIDFEFLGKRGIYPVYRGSLISAKSEHP